MNLLSRREHSQAELQTKLQQRGYDAALVEQVIARLAERGLQSDERFTESFIRHRSMQRQGPMKIRAELSKRGIRDELMQAAFAEQALDWVAIATEALARKFNQSAGSCRKEYARRQRFLASRGFSMEHIRAAMAATESDDMEWQSAIF
ncbi:hypothetical protein CWE15_07190 [Aliidiomarina taiwanensis]|uniref:Regulatory protein RecX n=2 Tax=Aliidiomarina taiwanensis TaxID=946228 RepID=A0A432X261_9GAMM|nr:hypothetical protein CWE15_07190 [Aliidiomarina taiwanensis]